MKQAMKKSAGSSGIMTLNKGLAKDVETQVAKWVDSAKRQGADIDKMSEQDLKYVIELNKPKPVKAISADSPEGKLFTQGLNDMLGKASGENVIKTDFGGGITDIVTETITKIKTLKPIDAMKEANSVIGRKGKYKRLTQEQSQKILKNTEDHIFERDIKYDPEDFAQGGRTGYFTGALADTEQGKSMSPGTRHDYSPGQGHRETAANKQLAEINKFHNMKAASTELKPPKKSIGKKISGGVNSFFNNPFVRGYAAWGSGGLSEKLRASMIAKQLYDNKNIYSDEAIEEEVSNIPTMGGITSTYAQGGRTGSGLNYLLGEDDQNSRVPFGEGSSQSDFNQFLKEREQRDKEEEKRKFKKDYEDWKKWQKTQGGTVDFAAEGGRMGFGLGGMSRRLFLKLMGGAAAGTAAAGTGLLGLLKGGGKKAAIKELTTVPIKAGADGMPLWFKPLVNKVIKEGEDVTKKFSTMDREIVHAAELPGSKTKVLVSQDITTGNVAVDIGYGKHGFSEGHLGQPVRLFYKAEEIIEPSITKNKEVINKAGKTEPEFWVDEAEFTGGHPENIKFEETISEKFGKHGSDFSEVEKFATGKVTKASKIGDVGKATPDSSWTPDDYASGGRVPLGGGGIAGMLGE